MTNGRTHRTNRLPRPSTWNPESLLVAAALVLLVAGCARDAPPAGEPALSVRAGGVGVRAWLDPNPPQQDTTVWLELRDPQEQPIEGARVSVGWSMPAMGSMQEMKGDASVVEVGPGTYRAPLDLPMTGSWSLPIAVETPVASARLELALNVGTPGLRLVSATGSGEGARGGTTPGEDGAVALPATDYPPAALEALRRATAGYDRARDLLVNDSLGGLAAEASEIATALERAHVAVEGAGETAVDSSVPAFLEEATRAARSLGAAGDLDAARSAFGELSRSLIAVAAADRRLVEGWQVLSCPMTETFPKWMQREGATDRLEPANPYMGQAMPACGTPDDWTVEAPEGLAEIEAHAEMVHGGGADGDEVSHYTCSMHPSVKRDAPGTCPICSMDLVPVSRQEVATGTFVVDATRRQQIGVRTEAARVEPVAVEIRAVGRVAVDQSRMSEVSVKYPGWIGRLRVDRPGQSVRRGDVLFELYSPQLYASQEELLAALESQLAARDTSVPDRADYLVDAARQRLRLWDLGDEQIERVAATGKPIQYLPILAPSSGVVMEKNVVAGSSVLPGQVLYRIARLDRVWIEADVYESELPLVAVGQAARVALAYLPARTFEGRVSFVYPYLDGASRTGTIRIELANPELELKPEMYANVVLVAERGERLTVPEEAVLYAGERRLVFVDLGEGRLVPRTVVTGVRSGERVEVLSGLEAGEVVVTSGNFLIAAESRLKSATGKWQ